MILPISARTDTRMIRRGRLAIRTAMLLAVVAVIFSGCSLLPWQSSRYGGESSEVYFLDVGRSQAREITYTLRLGSNLADVFFAFVNYGDGAAIVPTVTLMAGTPPTGSVVREPERSSVTAAPPVRIEPPAIAEFNTRPPEFVTGANPRSVGAEPAAASRLGARALESKGDQRLFYQYNGDFLPGLAVQTSATLRQVVTDDEGHTLNVWVADDEWSSLGAGDTDLVTQEKVDQLAAAFLSPGPDNDIRDWVTTALGEPWGEHGAANLLSTSDYRDTIDILLLDILLDGQTTGGVVGFFWGKDNYYQTSGTGSNTDFSNERVMFYLDAPMYAQREAGSWAIGNEWPELVISTLAHEFQHMIHFYQKNVLRSAGQDTQRWLNEMASMATEDLVSYQMAVAGPRGVDPTAYPAGTAGAGGNTLGWLSFFNANNDISIYDWDLNDSAPHYAINYGFGAFLVRNYGGPAFLRELIQNPYVDEQAIQAALDALGYRVTFREVLSHWAAAVLTSDEVIVPWDGGGLGEVYNAGEWFSATVGTTNYLVGSINLYNYASPDGISLPDGPRIYSNGSMGSTVSRPAGSVVYYEAAAGQSGTLEWQITLGATTDMVVVAKAVP